MRLALGTVQFGLDYGVSNATGRTPFAEVESILDFAGANDVELLDTAAAYGDAEDVLARAGAQARGFRIVSKTARLVNGLDAVVSRARESVQKLGRPLDTMMIHAAGDLSMPDGDGLWDALRKLQGEGAVQRLGISFYARDPILDFVARYRPEVAQIPTSIVDQRLQRDGTIEELARRGVEVHARSAFHQGLIFVDPDRLPEKLRARRAAIVAMQRGLAVPGYSRIALALSHLGRLAGIHSVVVGVTRRAELEEIVAAARTGFPDMDPSVFAVDDPVLLDPTAW